MAKKVVRRTRVPGGGRGRIGAEGTTVRETPIMRVRKGLNWTTVLIAVVVLAALAALAYFLLGAGEEAVADDGPREIAVPNEGQAHVEVGTPIVYRTNPPASGTHYPIVAQWRVYDEEVPTGQWVHNLEHGGIVFLYKCPGDDCSDRVNEIEEIAKTLPASKWNNVKFMAAPFNEMEPEYMAIAWDVQMPMETLDESALRRFYRRHVDRGPEDVP